MDAQVAKPTGKRLGFQPEAMANHWTEAGTCPWSDPEDRIHGQLPDYGQEGDKRSLSQAALSLLIIICAKVLRQARYAGNCGDEDRLAQFNGERASD